MIKKFLQSHPIHKKIVPRFDIIFIIRPTLFFAVWVMVISGMISAEVRINPSSIWITNFSLEIFSIFIGLTFLLSSAFILNHLSDHSSYPINQKIIIDKYVSIDKRKVFSRSLLIMGGGILIINNWQIAILSLCCHFLWGMGYNRLLIRWEQAPIVEWILNSFVGMLLFIIGWMMVMQNYSSENFMMFNIDIFFSMCPYILSFSAISLMIILFKIQVDAHSKSYSTFSLCNTTILIWISLFMISLAFFYSFIYNDPLAATATLVSLPFFIFAILRRLNKDVIRAIRYPIFIYNFFVLSYYPLLGIPLIIIYYFSKYYYWHRFDLHYPTFLVEND